MRLFFSYNSQDQLKDFLPFKKKFNILLSFQYIKAFTNDIVKLTDRYFILDSGAFTVWKTGGVINIQDYILCCKKLHKLLKNKLIIINLDVIPGKFGTKPTSKEINQACEQSYKNYEFIKSHLPNVKVMPVFHQYDNFEYLLKYLDKKEFLLGISPANDRSTKGRIPWLDKVFSIVKNKQECHGLAVTGQTLLERYPWYSADSATWVFSAGIGQTRVFQNGKIISYHYTDKLKVIKHNGMPFVDINKKYKYNERRLQNIKAFLSLSNYITDLWTKRGVTWDE